MGNKIGKLIAFEGVDCAGKSSVIKKLKLVLPVIYENEKFLYTREPGNLLSEDNESETIRKEVLSNKSLSVKEQAELFAKARYEHTKQIIEKLKEGYNVITDRYLLSSLIYQGIEIGCEEIYNLNKDTIDLLNENEITLYNLVFRISKKTYDERMNTRNEVKDSIEDVDIDMIKDRIEIFKSISNDDELRNIKNVIRVIDANGTNYNQILFDTLYYINNFLREE